MLLEIACFNLQSCIIAQKAGANRIELCENYKAGGVTPSQNLIIAARKDFNKDLFVMIRPRAGNFIYTDSEFEQMKSQIYFCKQNKCDGIVFGILNSKNKVDNEKCQALVDLAKPMECTFHRTFDEIENSDEALKDIIACGFSRILTSGKQKTAIQGIDLLSDLIQKSQGKILIMPGGGIRSANISELKENLNTTEFHSAAIINSEETADETEIRKLLSSL